MPQNMLGISIGTRSVGIAVFRKGHLVEWQVKSFKGKMNEQKPYMISGAILKLVREYDCKEVVIRMPNKAHNYENVILLKKHLSKSLTNRRIPIYWYSLSDIKEGLDISICNKQELLDWTANNYTQLRLVYAKEKKNKNSYYVKLFEAVAALHIHIHRT